MKTVPEHWGNLQIRILKYLSTKYSVTVRDMMRFLEKSYWNTYFTLQKLIKKELVEKFYKKIGRASRAYRITNLGLNFLLSLDLKQLGEGYNTLGIGEALLTLLNRRLEPEP